MYSGETSTAAVSMPGRSTRRRGVRVPLMLRRVPV